MRIFWTVLVYGLLQAGPAPCLENPAQKYLKFVESPDYTESSCLGTLGDLDLDLQKIHWDQLTTAALEEVQGTAAPRLQESWQLRQALHRKLAANGKACALKTREVFHKLRDDEDYLEDLMHPNLEALDPKSLDFQSQPVPIFDRASYPSCFVRPDLEQKKFEFHSGDIMLARGVSFVSAIITQVSTNHSHFSHVVTVHTGENGEGSSTVDSYIGSGVGEFALPFALKNENSRLLVLRPKDPEVAAAAAKVALTAAEKKLPYDYQMNYEDQTAMSCVEVPVFAFATASKNQWKLPSYPAAVAIHNPEFLERMGLRSGEIKTPDDLEIDPHFELVLDWKDLRLLRDSRYKDAVLSEMMRWISDLDYHFHDNLKSFLAMYLVKPVRSTFLWLWFQKLTDAPKIDKELPRATFGLMVLIDQLGERLLQEVRTQDEAYRRLHHRPMTNAQLRESLEAYRVRDLKIFQAKGSSEIHSLLRKE
jgi:hypothetical protein